MDRTERFYKIEMLLRSRGSVSFAALRDDGSTACGCWIYSGCYTEAGNNMARRDNRDPDGVFADGRRGSDTYATGGRIDPDMQVLDRFADQFHRQPGDLDQFSIHHATG